MRYAHLRIIMIVLLLLTAIPAAASSIVSDTIAAKASNSDIYVNSREYMMEAYNIEGYTYYKLRALAHSTNILVWYENETDTVYIDTTKPYDQNYASDAAPMNSQSDFEPAFPTKSKIIVNGTPADMESYLINNYNYFKLRDFTDNTNTMIYFNEASKTILLNSYNHINYETLSTQNTLQYIQEVIEIINTVRAEENLSPLIADEKLSQAAMYKCKDMSINAEYGHASKTYGDASVLMDIFEIPYMAWGENISAGQRTPIEVMTAFLNSPGHKENIMNSYFTHIGVGYLEDEFFGTLWAQEFAMK